MTGAQLRQSEINISDEGLAEGVSFVGSPNCDERPPNVDIDFLVVHAISLPPGEFGGTAIEAFFQNRLDPTSHPYYAALEGMRVSAHFLVRRDGALLQFVPCSKRAWHAGVSSWAGRERCNDFSIGVELEGTDDMPFEAQQYDALARLTRALIARYAIGDIAGHADIAPGRKTDPGPYFDWPKYRALLRA